jgi:hypothetical protein
MKSAAGLKVLDNGGRQATGMMRPYQKVGVAVRVGVAEAAAHAASLKLFSESVRLRKKLPNARCCSPSM